MFLKTNNQSIAARLEVPETHFLLERVRPDLLLMRVVCKSLVLWDSVVVRGERRERRSESEGAKGAEGEKGAKGAKGAKIFMISISGIFAHFLSKPKHSILRNCVSTLWKRVRARTKTALQKFLCHYVGKTVSLRDF
jgi:hypothetical protein